MRKRLLALGLALLLLLPACGTEASPLEQTAAYLRRTVRTPECGALTGDWIVLALARSGLTNQEDYVAQYYASLEAHVRETGGQLSQTRYTDYSRAVLVVCALGKDPAAVAGYDLLSALNDFEAVTAQGINGTAYALLALDAAASERADALRERYLQELLSQQNDDGGWALGGDESDVDITAIVLQALAAHCGREDVAQTVERGVETLAGMQAEDGTFPAWGIVSSESISQVLIALSALGIAPDDARFVKGSVSLTEVLLRFADRDGSFSHTPDGKADLVATQQALCALVAIWRSEQGLAPFYVMQA